MECKDLPLCTKVQNQLKVAKQFRNNKQIYFLVKLVNAGDDEALHSEILEYTDLKVQKNAFDEWLNRFVSKKHENLKPDSEFDGSCNSHQNICHIFGTYITAYISHEKKAVLDKVFILSVDTNTSIAVI